QIENSVELFKFEYMPIIDEDSRKLLLSRFKNEKLTKDLLIHIDLLFSGNLIRNLKIFWDRFQSALNKEEFICSEIEILKDRSSKRKSFPYQITKDIKFSDLENINLFANINEVLMWQKVEQDF